MTDPSGHLDLDGLADVLAGERDDDHVRSCDLCTDRLAELAGAQDPVTAALAALPAPPLPSGLPLRLTRALQEERRRELAAVRPLRRRQRVPAWLPGVAASVALVTAGGLGWSALDLSGGSDDSATSAADGGGSGQESQAAPEAATGLAVPPAGTDWADPAARPAALSRLLAATDSSAEDSTAASAVPSSDGLERLRDRAALDACLAALPGGGDDVLALDYASYAGAPALAVLQPADPGSVSVTVVGAGCSSDDPDLLDEVVVPRP